jgi:hypothetical protein
MDTDEYRKKLENQLLEEFVKKFHEKLGYYPTVLINASKKDKKYKLLSLNQIESYFEPFLPTVKGKKINLNTSSRKKPLPDLRAMFYYIGRAMKYNLSEMGRYMGNRDHTTVIHGLTVFGNLYETDYAFREKYHEIVNNIKKNNESSTVEHLVKMELES